MANRHFVFGEDGVEIPLPRRRPTAAREIPPGVPPPDGHPPPPGWTPVRIECSHLRRPDGTPEILLLYSRPCSPNSARQQQHWPGTRADDDLAEMRLRDGRRWSPEPLHEVEGTTRVVRLSGMLSLDELRDDELYQELLMDFTDEARKFGDLVKAVLPRPSGGTDPVVAGAGKVFLEYASLDDSIRCWTHMDGRWFGGRQIVVGFYPEERFAAGDYGYDGH